MLLEALISPKFLSPGIVESVIKGAIASAADAPWAPKPGIKMVN